MSVNSIKPITFIPYYQPLPGNEHLKNVDINLVNIHLPGVTELVGAGLAMKAKPIKNIDLYFDSETAVDETFRYRAHLSFFYALGSLHNMLALVYHVIHTSRRVGKFFKLVLPFVAYLLSALEAASECVSISRLLRLSAKMAHADPRRKIVAIMNDYLILQKRDISQIKYRLALQFPNLSAAEYQIKFDEFSKSALEAKERKLARRIRPWLVTELKEKLPDLIKKLNLGNIDERMEGMKGLDKLSQQIQTQIDKKIFTHVVGLVSIAFLVAGLMLTPFGVPAALLLAFSILSIAISFTRYFLVAGMLDTPGWQFHGTKCLPERIQKLFETKVIENKVA